MKCLAYVNPDFTTQGWIYLLCGEEEEDEEDVEEEEDEEEEEKGKEK